MRVALFAAYLVLLFITSSAITLKELKHFHSLLLDQNYKEFLKNPDFVKDHVPKQALDDQTPHPRSKRQTFLQNCPAGYTGAYCENPVCSNPQQIGMHDGNADSGEIIYNGNSRRCGSGDPENYTVPLDVYLGYTTIQIEAILPGAFPATKLYSPNGTYIMPDSQEPDPTGKWETTTYQNLINDFGPGQYRFTINAIDNIPCSFSILARTPMVVDGGFVQNVTDDKVQENFMTATKGVERNPLVNTANWFGFKPFNLNNPGQATVIAFYKGGTLQYTPYNVRFRYSCTAYDFAGPYICTEVTGIYHLIVSGLDHTGNVWQRMYLFGCDSQGIGTITPPPVTGASAQPTGAPQYCYNGGTMTTDGSGNKRCYCGQYFEGYQCEQKKCFNDGRLGPEGVCACVPGYTGTFCQDVQCKKPNMGDFSTSRAALGFVIRGTKTMLPLWNDLYQAANNLLTTFNSYPGYIQQYVLIIFANGNLTYVLETADQQNFLLAINDARSMLVDATSCFDTVYTGISAALSTDSFHQYKRSPIYVWTDALPNDDDSIRYNLYGQIGAFRGQIFTSFPQSSNDSCVVDPADRAYRGLRQLAMYSQGLVSRENSSNLKELTGYTASSIRNGVHLATNDLIDQCSYAPNYQTFFIDETVGNVYIYAYGNSLTIVVNGPNRQIVNPTVIKQFGNTYVQLFSNLAKGNYLITVSSSANPPGPCAYRVIGNSNSNAFIATASSLTTDMNTPYGFNPIFQQDNYMVAHINGLNVADFTGVMAEMTVWTNEAPNRTRTMVYASNGFYRDSCDYHFQFGQWKCPRPNLLFYATIYVEDGTGYIMQRVVTGMCVTVQLCVDGCTGCQNGGAPDPTNRTNCLCPPGYSGQNCQNIVCQNGGTPNVYDCLCNDGWTGLHCQRPTCIRTDYDTNFSPNGKSLTIAVHNSASTRNVLQKMQSVVAQTVQEIQMQHPVWINNYKLLSFTDVGAPTAAADTDDPNLFLQAFKTLVNNNQNNGQYSCKYLRVAETIYLTLKSATTTQYGIIYIFLTGLPNINNTVLYEINEMLQVSHVQVNFVQGSPLPCGASLSDPAMQILFNIAESTGGTVYIANQDYSGQALLSTPSNFAKSYVYQNFVPDCSNISKFYFPVESETQTLQIQIFGDLDDSPSNPAVTYLAPDASFVNVNNLYNDIGSNARVAEILKPCDQGWKLYDHQCWYFDYNQKTWLDAWNTCANMGGILPTLYNAKTENDFFFEINNQTAWIGLNDMAAQGNWIWAQLNGNGLSLSNTGYTNWGSGMPINDTIKRCVSDQKTNKWKVEDCNTTQHFYACVKHVYDYTNVFEGENANFLPSGMWTVSVKTYKDPGGPPAPCEVKVFSQSGIRAFLGYSFNVHNDLESYEPYQDARANYFVSHVMSISKSDLSMLRLMYAHFYVTDNMQMTGVQQFSKRDTGSCNWEYASTAFQCPQNSSSTAFHPYLNANTSAFQTALTGIDYAGYLFQRIRPTVCHIRNPLKNCDNGGVYDKTRQHCVCSPDWYGDRCELPVCYNNGKMDQTFFECVCPAIVNPPAPNKPLYSGDHCEYANCIRGGNNGLPLPITTNKTFILVLDGSYVGLMGGVISNLPQILTNITQFYPGVFTSYVGVVVRDSSFAVSNLPLISPIYVGTNLNTWIQSLQAELAKSQYNSTTNDRLLLTGLRNILIDMDALKLIQPQSHVFVLTGGIASDPDREHQVQDKIAPLQLAVNFIYLGDQSQPGGSGVDAGRDPRTRAMYELAYITGGGFYQVHNWTNAESFWYTVVAHRLNSYYIQSSRSFNCSSHFEYFQVGSSNTKILFDVYVQNPPFIVVTSNNGSQVAVQTITRTNTNYLFSMDSRNAGIWKISIDQNNTNAGFCAISIKGVDPINQVAWAFTQDTVDNGAHTNDAILYPDGRNTSVNVILANVPMGRPTFAQIYDVFERTILWSSPFIHRKLCTYNYATQYSFRSCPAEQFMLAVEGYDTALNPYRRVGMVHCVNYHD